MNRRTRMAVRIISFCLCALSVTARADEEPNAAEELGMTQNVFTLGNLSIDYCERVFRFGSSPMSIVLLWHGGSGRGDDNLAQLTTPSLRPLLSYLAINRINSVVLVPQCPSSAKSWISGGERSPMMATRALVRNKAQSYRVASTNVFFAGISMGGTAAYSLLAADTPNLFHKAIVCSGAGDTSLAPAITAIVRLFNGEKDSIVDPAGGQAMADAINAAGGKAFFNLLPDHDHVSAADVAFSFLQWDWFFKPNANRLVVLVR
ncbi:MAG: hypothetical protein IJR99_09980 [Kiritimatiellae bacterium]|nr:hypothetical protein [Kiritimatiellia bacterium]